MRKVFYIVCASFCLAFVMTGCKETKAPAPQPEPVVEEDTIVPVQEEGLGDKEKGVSPNVIQERLLREFYKKYVFGDEPVKRDVLSHYCTEMLIDKLKNDNSAGDGGYAMWDFRDKSQGNASSEGRITTVSPVNDACLEVHFTDNGTEGSHKVYFAPDGNQWRIDRIQ